MAVREVEFRRRKLMAAFKRAEQLRALRESDEIQADFARHLCILISGFVERSVAEIILNYASQSTARPLHSFLDNSLKRLTNVDKERLLQIVGSMDAAWRDELEVFIVDERQAALNSIVGLRNDIAHGGGSSVSLSQVMRYWEAVDEIVGKVEELIAAPRRRGRQGTR